MKKLDAFPFYYGAVDAVLLYGAFCVKTWWGTALFGLALLYTVLTFLPYKRMLYLKALLASPFALVSLPVLVPAILLFGKKREISASPYAVVLGSKLKNNAVTPTLKRRLDAAKSLADAGKQILLSGGKGSEGRKSESACMQAYLKALGVPEEALLTEDASCNTYENMLYTKKALANKPGFDGRLTVVTDETHLLRARRYARMAGLHASFYGAAVPASGYKVFLVLREVLVLWYGILFLHPRFYQMQNKIG